MEIKTERIELDSMEDAAGLFGVLDENISVFEQETGTLITVNGDGICIEGEAENAALCRVVQEKLLSMQRKGEPINRSRIRYAVDLPRAVRATTSPMISEIRSAFPSRARSTA